MARLVGVDLPREKRMEVALTYIFGVGRTRAMATLAATGVDPGKRAKDLSDDETGKLRDYLEANYKVEVDLRRQYGEYQPARLRTGGRQETEEPRESGVDAVIAGSDA